MATAMLKLYEHVDDYRTILDWIEEHADEIEAAGGEVPEYLEGLLDAAVEGLEEKVKRTALVVQNLGANAKAAKSEADRLAATARTYERQAEVLKRYLKIQLERAGVPRVETELVKARIQTNGRPTIVPLNPDAIPEAYQRVRVEFDGAKAYDELKSAGLLPTEPGEVVIDGLRVTLGTHLRIW